MQKRSRRTKEEYLERRGRRQEVVWGEKWSDRRPGRRELCAVREVRKETRVSRKRGKVT